MQELNLQVTTVETIPVIAQPEVFVPVGKKPPGYPRQPIRHKPTGCKPSQQFLDARPRSPLDVSFRKKHGDEGWMFILRMYAEFNTSKKICEAVQKVYNFKISQPSISGIVHGREIFGARIAHASTQSAH